jgi:flagellar FliL protein
MADEKDIVEGEPQAGGGKKKLIVLIGGVVLLLVIGAAAFFLMGGDDEESTDAETTEAVEEAEAVVEEGDPEYYKLDPTFVVNLAPGGSAKMLQIAIEVMTYQPTVVSTLKNNDPMIRHHLLNLLEGQQAAELMTAEGKRALQTAIHDLLSERLEALKEPGKIKGVFFTQFVMQ